MHAVLSLTHCLDVWTKCIVPQTPTNLKLHYVNIYIYDAVYV